MKSIVIILSLCLITLVKEAKCYELQVKEVNYQERTLFFILNNLENIYAMPINIFNKSKNNRIFYRYSINNDTTVLSNKLNSWSKNYHVYKDTLVSNDVDLKDVNREKELVGIDESRICDLSISNCLKEKKDDLTLIVGKEVKRSKKYYVFVFLYAEGYDILSSVLLLKFNSEGEVERIIRTEGII